MKKRYIVVILIILIPAIFNVYCFIFNDNSNADELTISSLRNISQDIFDLYDKGYLAVGETIDIDNEYNKERLYEIKNIMNKSSFDEDIEVIHKKNKILELQLVDKDVIFFSEGAYFQGVNGIAVIRNNIELKDTYKCTGYDGGISYKRIESDVFLYTAGL